MGKIHHFFNKIQYVVGRPCINSRMANIGKYRDVPVYSGKCRYIPAYSAIFRHIPPYSVIFRHSGFSQRPNKNSKNICNHKYVNNSLEKCRSKMKITFARFKYCLNASRLLYIINTSIFLLSPTSQNNPTQHYICVCCNFRY
jgi:hypothetical protein